MVFAEALAVIGLSPICSADRPSSLPEQLLFALADAVSVGRHSEPNLELVLSLDPDLILAQERQRADHSDWLSAIALTLLLNEPEEEWRA